MNNVAEYLAHERRDLVPRAEGRQLLDGVDALRDDVDRFEARPGAPSPAARAHRAVNLRVFVRLVHIQRVLLRHRLDELVRATHLYGRCACCCCCPPASGWHDAAPARAGKTCASR
ncbi:MAG: hypothetical protein WDM77_06870 [Steroidobacteraceae bacterium]